MTALAPPRGDVCDCVPSSSYWEPRVRLRRLDDPAGSHKAGIQRLDALPISETPF